MYIICLSAYFFNPWYILSKCDFCKIRQIWMKWTYIFNQIVHKTLTSLYICHPISQPAVAPLTTLSRRLWCACPNQINQNAQQSTDKESPIYFIQNKLCRYDYWRRGDCVPYQPSHKTPHVRLGYYRTPNKKPSLLMCVCVCVGIRSILQVCNFDIYVIYIYFVCAPSKSVSFQPYVYIYIYYVYAEIMRWVLQIS